MEDPEMQSCINRKIAQLTKVIYKLSTIQEDHDVHLQALTDAYEQEVEDILLDANAKLAACAREAREAKLNSVTKAEVEELKAKLLAAVEATENELVKHKAALDAEAWKRQVEWAAQLEQLQSDWRAWQASLASASLALKASAEDFEASKEALQQELKSRTNHVEILEGQLAAATKLSGDLRAETLELQQRLTETAAERDAAREAAAAAATLSEVQQQTSCEQTQAVAAKLQRLEHQKQREEETHKKTLKAVHRQLQEEHEKAERAEEARQNAKEEAERLKSFLRGAQAEGKALKEEAKSLREKTETLEEIVQQLRRDCALREAQERQASKCLLSERELRVSAATGFRRRVAELEEEVSRREEQLQRAEGRCKALEELLEETSLATAQREKETQETFRRQLEARLNELQVLQRRNTQLNDELQEAKRAENAAKESEALCKSSMEEAARIAKGKFEEATLSARRAATERDATAAQALRKLEEKLAESEMQLAEKCLLVQKLANEGEERGKEMLRLQDELHQKQIALKEAQEAAAALELSREETEKKAREMNAAASSRLEQLTLSCKQLTAKAETLERQLDAAQLRSERQAQEAWGVEHTLRAQLKILQTETEEKENKLTETLQILTSLQKQEELLQQSVSEYKMRLAEEEKKSEEAAAKHHKELQQQKETLKTEQERAVAAAAAAAAAEKKAFQQQHEEEMRQAEKTKEKEKADLKIKLIDAHAAQLQAVICSHREQQEERDAEHRKERDALEARHKEAAAAAAGAAAAKIKAATDHAALLQQQLKSTNLQLAECQEEAERRQQALKALRLTHEETLAAHQAAVERHKEELIAKEKETQKKEKSMELLMTLKEQGLVRDHEAALAEMQTEHKAENELHESRIASLEKQIALERTQYEERPSREEDIEEIEKLKRLLEESVASLAQREEIVRKLKLELLTHDKNYNKVFSASPSTGVVNPLEKPASRRRARRSSTNSTVSSSEAAARRGSKQDSLTLSPLASSIALPQ